MERLVYSNYLVGSEFGTLEVDRKTDLELECVLEVQPSRFVIQIMMDYTGYSSLDSLELIVGGRTSTRISLQDQRKFVTILLLIVHLHRFLVKRANAGTFSVSVHCPSTLAPSGSGLVN